jgi:two-component system, OmpR family, sensor kinase
MFRKGPRRGKLRTKVVAGVLAVTLVALAVFDFTAIAALRKYLISQTDGTLKSALAQTQGRLTALLPAVRKPGTAADLPVAGEYYMAWVPVKGAVVNLQAGPGQALPVSAVVATASGQPGGKPMTKREPMNVVIREVPQYRIVSMSVPAESGTLVAGTNLAGVDATVGRLELIIATGSAAAAVLIFLGVGLVMRRGLRPIEEMARQADLVTAGDLTDRVTPADTRSEVGRLGTALNGMLGRIQTSVAEREAGQELMRSFFADASHELRTPLASLCANAELYQQGALIERSQVDEAMRRITLEAQRMGRLVDDMLRLARLDQHPDQRRDLVDLSALVGTCVERARVADPARTWPTDLEAGLAVAGDEEQLCRAVDNLLANVHAHTPAGTVTTITARNDGSGRVVVEVSDDGPGVPAEGLARIFDRFYRAGAPSGRRGSGLGLAIVSQIAAAHQGTATAAPNHPHGLRVTLTLPSWRWM